MRPALYLANPAASGPIRGENPRGLDHPTMGERWSCGCLSFALWGDAHGQGGAHRLPQAISYGT